MEKQVKEIIVPTIVYAFASMATLWLFTLNQTSIPYNYMGKQYTLSLSFFSLPLLASFTALYASILTEKLLVGEVVKPLIEGFRRLAVTSFLYLISDFRLIPSWLRPLLAFTFFASILFMVHKTLSSVLEPVNPLFKPILNSVYILIIGFLGSITWLDFSPYLVDMLKNSGIVPMQGSYLQEVLTKPINNVIVVSSILVSALALTGVMRNHPNVFFRFLSIVASSRLERSITLSFIVLYYVFFVRAFLLQVSGINPQYIVVGEWAMLCVGFYMAYRGLKRYASEQLIREDYTGTWRRHVQQVSRHSEPELELFETLLDRFVNEGERDELVVRMTLLLKSSGLGSHDLTRALSPLINYSHTSLPKMGFSWQVESTKRHNIQMRRGIINTVLGSIQLKPDKQDTEKRGSHREDKEAG